MSANHRHNPELRVVVIDDNEDCAVVLKKLLEHLGCDVEIYHGGAEAIEGIIEFRPTVAFIDAAMPGIDGLEVGRRLRSIASLTDTHLVAFTGYGDPVHRDLIALAGFNELVLKPVTLDQIAEIICRLAEEQGLYVPGCNEAA